MEAFVQNLQKEVQEKLDKVDPNIPPIEGCNAKIEVIEWAIKEMKHYLWLHPLSDKATEVKYYKYWAPTFCKLQFYFATVLDLELRRVTSDNETFLNYLHEEKERIAIFFENNHVLHRYYYSRKSSSDETIFVHKPLSGSPGFLTFDSSYCENSLTLSALLAYEDYRKILDKEIGLFAALIEDTGTTRLKWVGTKSEAVEWIAAAVELGTLEFDGRPATLEEVKAGFEKNFNIDLSDFGVVDNKNRNRKKSSTPFFDKLIQAFNNRKNRLDP